MDNFQNLYEIESLSEISNITEGIFHLYNDFYIPLHIQVHIKRVQYKWRQHFSAANKRTSGRRPRLPQGALLGPTFLVLYFFESCFIFYNSLHIHYFVLCLYLLCILFIFYIQFVTYFVLDLFNNENVIFIWVLTTGLKVIPLSSHLSAATKE